MASTVPAGCAQKDFTVKHPPPLPVVGTDCKETPYTCFLLSGASQGHTAPCKISQGRRLHQQALR